MKQFNNLTIKPLLAVFLVIFLSSCAHLTYLDNAQDSFSKGAVLENKSLFDQTSASSASPETYYSLAYGQVQSALKSKGKLEKVGVLGSAYTIKALCEWKLKKYSAAKGSAKAAKESMNSGSDAAELRRDYVIMEALDGLIGIESSNDALYNYFNGEDVTVKGAKSKYMELIANKNNDAPLQKAFAELTKVNEKAPTKHEVRIYLQSSRFAGMKVWSDALSFTKTILQDNNEFVGETKKRHEKEEMKFLEMKKTYLTEFKSILPNGDKNPLYGYWNLIL